MSEIDTLSHPDLRRMLSALESASPDVDWAALAVPRPRPRRRLRPVVVVAALAVALLVANETVGVLAASQALASGPVVSDTLVSLEISTRIVQAPWDRVSDLSRAGSTIYAIWPTENDTVQQWILDPDLEWSPLPIGGFVLLRDSEWFRGRFYVSGVVGHADGSHTGAVWVFDATADAWVEVFSLAEGEGSLAPLGALSATKERLVVAAIRHEDGRWNSEVWQTTDGESWGLVELEGPSGSWIANAASLGDFVVAVGYSATSIPLVPLVDPAIWISDGSSTWKQADIPGMRSLGFGYLAGGLRLSDGLEQVTAAHGRFLAYTGFLQVWGIQNGIIDPSEAWSSLVVVSDDGTDWEPRVLPGFAIESIVPFGEGFLATAALPPPSDTVLVEDEGELYEVAASPPSRLYFSEDGLMWHPVEGSPEFSKPLLISRSNAEAVVIDEHAAEDTSDGDPNTTVYVVTP